MANPVGRFATIAMLGLVTACATPGQQGTEVTRFHLDQPIAGQPFTVEPAEGGDPNSLEFRTYADIVAAQLARLNFTRAEDLGAAEMVAVVDIVRGSRIEAAQRPPFSIGIGGGSFGGGVGGGLGVSTGLGGSRGGEVMVTRLDVALKRRSDGSNVWEGSAMRTDDPEMADPAATVARLADALFQDFPGESGRTIIVE